MDWLGIDWRALDRLRDGFLAGKPAQGPYWQSQSDLASYDFTYGERIGWKWDQVLRELRLRGWRPSARDVVDWGCGSGIAGRRMIEFFGPQNFSSLTVWDHSPAACEFAVGAAGRAFPELTVSSATPGFVTSSDPIGLLVISHVLNELSATELAGLRAMILRAAEVVWVEPGTHAVSRSLSALRNEFLATFHIVAPCTHQGPCPALSAGNERDWCHFFAPPPGEIFADSNWVKFSQRAGIDLRSLPYCFVAMEKCPPDGGRSVGETPPGFHPDTSPVGDEASPVEEAPLSRVIGRPEHFKPYARVLSCDATGLTELELPKRTDPALFKQLERTKSPLVYRWRRNENKILEGKLLE